MQYLTRLNPMGGYNGYVVIPPTSSLVREGTVSPEKYKWLLNLNLSVNGGITFHEEFKTKRDFKGWGIKDKKTGTIVVGFDTLHSWDSVDKWPRWKVREEAKKLKMQLLSLE